MNLSENTFCHCAGSIVALAFKAQAPIVIEEKQGHDWQNGSQHTSYDGFA